MTPEEFRRNGYAAIDWVADHLRDCLADDLGDDPAEGLAEDLRDQGRRAVTPDVEPGDIAAKLSIRAPEQPEEFETLLGDLDRVVVPGTVDWQSPNWFAYFPANASPPSILAEMVAAALGSQGMLWSTAPAATEIESRVLDWLVEMMGLPASWRCDGPGGGVIQTSASDATHAVLVVTRHGNRSRAAAEDMVVYTSEQAHSSVEKGCTVAGIGHCRTVTVDSEFAMVPAALEAAIQSDLDAGLTPIAVVSTVGTTATTAVDPIDVIGPITRRHALWHHVDAAYAGTAMICDEHRRHQPSLDQVDSYTFNPHKWMMVNFDCSVLWVADRRPLVDTMSITPPYLRDERSSAGAVIDYRDWQVPLGRRFRALKLWWVIRSYGVEGLRSLVREHVGLAAELAARIEADPRLELFAPHPFSLVCFTHRDGDGATETLARKLNGTGSVAVTASEIDATSFVRVSIGQSYTQRRHVERLWDLIDAFS